MAALCGCTRRGPPVLYPGPAGLSAPGSMVHQHGCAQQGPPVFYPGPPGLSPLVSPPQSMTAQCGGVAPVIECLESQSESEKPEWQFVGPGGGGYERATSYQFVGHGAGSWEPQEVVTYYGWKIRSWCFVLLMVAALACAILLAVFYLQPTASTTVMVFLTSSSVPTAPVHNCTSGADLSAAEIQDCCEKFHMHCTTPPPKPPKPSTPSPPVRPTHTTSVSPPSTTEFDCDVGLENWIRDWPIAKKSYCCRHRGKGCPPRPSSPLPADRPQKTGASVHNGEQTVTTTHFPVDCGEGWANWKRGWSRAKKDWCCQHENKACV
mmetsp:Transcript_147913/g.384524  ORF Transcript_147913/g.384524 Transcript_147913/m.384524 type:complete len:321 (-) Transcript_147913:32-994(-)